MLDKHEKVLCVKNLNNFPCFSDCSSDCVRIFNKDFGILKRTVAPSTKQIIH